MICRKYRIIFGKLTFRQFSLQFFIENNSFFRGSLINVSFIKTTVSVEGVLQLSLHFIMIIIYMYVIKYKIKSIGETVNLQYPCSISVISLKVNVGN